ncbi:uncharacterized protein LOC110459112 [Mizuhopecten yessoensis]|uniref:uncharacterized protein LOC110459112 n=1 Tax=Mizuhopecten yessoensis TaxID=6573 RepID=UPI000B459C4C|nr:uncharacterized protein LOC110459112 [Mizuhopecten yessoensis]
MTSLNGYVILWVLILTIVRVHSLECWKCISDDCEGNPEINYRARKTTCGEDASCMKVRYKMYYNLTKTVFDSIIRTCSSGECKPVTEKDFAKCTKDDRLYMVNGCSLRTCCNDQNYCNSGNLHQLQVRVLVGTLSIVSLILYVLDLSS